jgi:hypothetical protein
MKRLLVAAVYLLLMAASAGVASAESPAQQGCEAAGGVFTFSNGDPTCTFRDQTWFQAHPGHAVAEPHGITRQGREA